MDILRNNNISPGVICTTTKRTINLAKEGFLSLVKNGFKGISFNAFYNTAGANEDQYAVSNNEWLGFLKEIFDAWIELNNPRVRIREIDQMLCWAQSRKPKMCSFKGTCKQWLVVDWNGDIFPCERLGRKIKFGNIFDVDDINEILKSDNYLNFAEQISIMPKKCQDCKIKNICNNGCTAHRCPDENGVPRFAYCDSRINFYEYVKSKLGV